MDKAENCFLIFVPDGAMCCYSGVFYVLGGFTGATLAMTRNTCMESSVSQMALRKYLST